MSPLRGAWDTVRDNDQFVAGPTTGDPVEFAFIFRFRQFIYERRSRGKPPGAKGKSAGNCHQVSTFYHFGFTSSFQFLASEREGGIMKPAMTRAWIPL